MSSTKSKVKESLYNYSPDIFFPSEDEDIKEQRIKIKLLQDEFNLTEDVARRYYLNSITLTKQGYSKTFGFTSKITKKVSDTLQLADGNRRLGFLLFHLYKAYRIQTTVLLSRSNFSTTERSYGVNREFFIEKLIDPMVELGLIEQYMGFSKEIDDRRYSIMTRIKASGVLVDLFKEYDDQVITLGLENDLIEYIPKHELIKVKKCTDSNKFVDFSHDNREYIRMYKSTSVINSIISSHNISLNPVVIDLIKKSFSDKITVGQYNSLMVLERKLIGERSLNITDLFYYIRIFNHRGLEIRKDFFKNGGRYWCSGSNLPNRSIPIRDNIQIDGEPTIELDYSTLHPSIVAAENGQTSVPNIYEDLNERFLNDKKANKELVNSLLNCESLKQANSYIYHNYIGKHQLFRNSITKKDVLEFIINKHPYIKDSIGTGEGIRLQNIDSMMAEEIMIQFIEKTNSPVLCWHDSFRVQEKYSETLKTIMLDVWHQRYPNFPMTVKKG